jgi:hypothetical protein
MRNTKNCYLQASRPRWHHLHVQAAKCPSNGDFPSTFLLQHRIQHYKLDNTKNLRKERNIISYQPLGLADVTVRVIVVHQRLAPSVVPIFLREGSELHGRPPLEHRVPSLRIYDESIDLPLKLLLLGQVEIVHLAGFYRLLQHL